MNRLLMEVRQITWQHVLGFALIVVPVGMWMARDAQIRACGQLTIVEVCK